jgi:hypothetical protein
MTNEKNQIELPEGFSFLALPDFGSEPADLEETLERLNAFLKPINEQGARVVQLIQLPIALEPRPGIIGTRIVDGCFALIDVPSPDRLQLL